MSKLINLLKLSGDIHMSNVINFNVNNNDEFNEVKSIEE